MEGSNQDEAVQPSRQYSVANVKVSGALKPEKRGGATLTQVGDCGPAYLIGGANREGLSFGDVHRFDFDTCSWTLVKPSCSSFAPRSGHSAVAIGHDIYVFGGMDAMESEIYNDVHVFNTRTSTWRQPEVEGDVPNPRNAHAAILLPETARSSRSGERHMLMFGGSSPECGAYSDLFLLHIPINTAADTVNTLRWEKLATTGEIPEARELHCAVQQSETSICFAGGRNQDGKVCTDMALLDVEHWSWQLVPMCGWNRCSLAAGVVDGEMISFGGFDGGQICGDCCRYKDDEESWLPVEHCTSKNPSVQERFGHCGITVTMKSTTERGHKTRRQGLLVFGGMNAASDLNDLVLVTPR